jgi:hypothetical protein
MTGTHDHQNHQNNVITATIATTLDRRTTSVGQDYHRHRHHMTTKVGQNYRHHHHLMHGKPEPPMMS